MTKVGIISLGCPRNLVDSEVMLGLLKKEGFEISDSDKGVDVFIVNTCSFVYPARKESVDTVLEAAQLKKEGRIKYLILSGCLAQLYGSSLLKEFPEVDAVLGTSDFPKIIDCIKRLKKGEGGSFVSDKATYIYDENSPRFSLSPKHFAYVKISEGCSNLCSYCIIPELRGLHRSRPIESILAEAMNISSGGYLKEINLVGQDTTLFGKDIYGAPALDELLQKLSKIKDSVEWIRILYTHPAHYTDNLIKTVRDERKICKYLDLPIQHINDTVLRRMNRRVTKKDIIRLIENLRKNIPGLVLRTSIIVGFPGESDRIFRELLDFICEMRFERLGCFVYSREARTKADRFSGHVPENIKKMRFDEVMRRQQKISVEFNKNLLGKEMQILIDERAEGEKDDFIGRSYMDAPEVDGTVHVRGNKLKVGNFYKVRITDTLEYDLVGMVK